MKNHPLVSLSSIGKTYVDNSHSVSVFADFDVEFYEGEISAVLGPTGCGKSTLLGIIDGLVTPSSGSVRFSRPRKTLRIGTKLQKDLLLPWRTVKGNARLAREIVNVGGETESDVTEILETLGLLSYQHLYPDQLSGGMRQKLSIARTLLLDPDLLLLDEPFSNIDFHQKIDLEKYCSNWIRTRGRTAIVVTHDVEEAISMADRIIVLTEKPARIALNVRLEFSDKDNDPWDRRKTPEFYPYIEKACAALRQ